MAKELTMMLTEAEVDLLTEIGNEFGFHAPLNILKKLMIDKLNSKPVKAVKIINEWQGMKCKTCDRYNTLGECDFHGEQSDFKYCEDFIPNSKVSKEKILQMWRDHTQRFITERRVHGMV
ncbi:hypothetical protein [Candidatus Lokiarchaeum ossiferum]|uniref:hypothetical protein n=1 Tax=Candidatus Lokiarchaeum ossiferum TaxID=2951803 RepID=UPI00352C99C8